MFNYKQFIITDKTAHLQRGSQSTNKFMYIYIFLINAGFFPFFLDVKKYLRLPVFSGFKWLFLC